MAGKSANKATASPSLARAAQADGIQGIADAQSRYKQGAMQAMANRNMPQSVPQMQAQALRSTPNIGPAYAAELANPTPRNTYVPPVEQKEEPKLNPIDSWRATRVGGPGLF